MGLLGGLVGLAGCVVRFLLCLLVYCVLLVSFVWNLVWDELCGFVCFIGLLLFWFYWI